MAKVNTYPTATVEDADLILGWDDSAARVIAPALTAWRAALITGAASTIATAALTASRALASDGTGKVAVSTTTTTELQGLHGLTASRAVATDGSGILTPSATTATELGYVNGVTSAIQTQIDAINTRPVINLLPNGGLTLWDLGATPGALDNAYFAPGWRYLSDATSTQAASQSSSSPPDGSRYFVALDGTVAGHPSVGVFGFIRADEAIPLQGKTVTLRFYAKPNGTDRPAIHAAILAWTGTADGLGGDPIATWNAGNPTFAAGYTAENTVATILSAATDWDLCTVTATLDTPAINNVAVLIFGYAADAARARWDLAQVQLHVGPTVVDFVHRSVQEERNFTARDNYLTTTVAAPGVTDDIASGYALGSNWIDFSAADHYICCDPTEGAAVWSKTTP